MNLLNYVDRYVFFSVKELIAADLKLDDGRLGVLDIAFMVVYTLASPLVGWMGDRYSRTRLMCFGVGLWSVATLGTASARDFPQMFFWRALLGVGEASYGIIAPTLLADLFSPRHRGRVMGLYFLALPLGGALGYGVGGYVGQHASWWAAFLVVGMPGLFLAAAGMFIRDPGRGASEGGPAVTRADRPTTGEYLSLFRNRSFLLNTAGLAAVTFATGAYAAWGAVFYQRVRDMSPRDSGLYLGGMSAVAGLAGILLGTWAADAFQKLTRRAYMLWPAFAVTLALPFAASAMLIPDRFTSLALLFGASVLLASVLGPSNTVTANVVPANRRAAGFALSIFLIHLFGDISSPLLIGLVSKHFGRADVAASGLGQALASAGIRPVSSPGGGMTNLSLGMLAVVPMLMLGGLFFFLGSRSLPADQDRARQAGGDDPPSPAFFH